MKVSMISEVAAKPTLRALVRIASQSLEGLMGPSGDEVEAEWRAVLHGTDTLLHVTLRDVHAAVGCHFKLEDFADLRRVDFRLSALWNQLLDQGPKSAAGHVKDRSGSRQESRQAGSDPSAAAGRTATEPCVKVETKTVFTVAAGPEGVHLSNAAQPFPEGAAVGKLLYRLTVSGGKRNVKPPSWAMTAEAYGNWKNILSWSGYEVDERPV